MLLSDKTQRATFFVLSGLLGTVSPLFLTLPRAEEAEPKMTTIVCEYSGTYNLNDGTYSQTSGSDSFVIVGDKAVISDYGIMTGSITPYRINVAIEGDPPTDQPDVGGLKRELQIDRLSGRVTLLFTVKGFTGGLIHDGTCYAAQQRF